MSNINNMDLTIFISLTHAHCFSPLFFFNLFFYVLWFVCRWVQELDWNLLGTCFEEGALFHAAAVTHTQKLTIKIIHCLLYVCFTKTGAFNKEINKRAKRSPFLLLRSGLDLGVAS